MVKIPSTNSIIISKKQFIKKVVAGVDEAGRGSWAGPVVASAVVLSDGFPISILDDSKKLSPKKREIIYRQIIKQCQVGIGEISAREIDKIGIKKATEQAMNIAVDQLSSTGTRPTGLLVDGNDKFVFSIPHKSIVKGDEKIPAISAASIVAKVWRDRYMVGLDDIMPHYKMGKHKGYGTDIHSKSLQKYGVSPQHRHSYRPVADIKNIKKPRLLLHVCCGPDASASIQILQQAYQVDCYWYDPNIEPKEEYIKRLEEFEKVAKKTKVKYEIGAYDVKKFHKNVEGLEKEPEKGRRCAVCFAMRLSKTAKKAKLGNYDFWATTLTISPKKNIDVINKIGEKIGKSAGVQYLSTALRKHDGYLLSLELCEIWGIWRQSYCGCSYEE